MSRDFSDLNRLATTSVLSYLESIELTDVAVRDLNALGATLVRIIKRARRARSNQKTWTEVTVRCFQLAYQIIDALSELTDEVSVAEKSSSLSWLRELTVLSEIEDEVDQQETPQWDIPDSDLKDLIHW